MMHSDIREAQRENQGQSTEHRLAAKKIYLNGIKIELSTYREGDSNDLLSRREDTTRATREKIPKTIIRPPTETIV